MKIISTCDDGRTLLMRMTREELGIVLKANAALDFCTGGHGGVMSRIEDVVEKAVGCGPDYPPLFAGDGLKGGVL